MAQINQFELGSVYDFTTYAPALLGTFKNVRVDGVVDYRIARNYIDPAAYHANIYGSLPDGETPDDHRKYYYLILVQPSGSKTAIGVPWINGDSVELKERHTLYVTIEDASPDDQSRVKRALEANGFTVANIRVD